MYAADKIDVQQDLYSYLQRPDKTNLPKNDPAREPYQLIRRILFYLSKCASILASLFLPSYNRRFIAELRSLTLISRATSVAFTFRTKQRTCCYKCIIFWKRFFPLSDVEHSIVQRVVDVRYYSFRSRANPRLKAAYKNTAGTQREKDSLFLHRPATSRSIPNASLGKGA